jgi:hypothetical protein
MPSRSRTERPRATGPPRSSTALADLGRALAEARRVLAPGERMLLCGHDWHTFVIDSSDPELTCAVVQKRADLDFGDHRPVLATHCCRDQRGQASR